MWHSRYSSLTLLDVITPLCVCWEQYNIDIDAWKTSDVTYSTYSIHSIGSQNCAWIGWKLRKRERGDLQKITILSRGYPFCWGRHTKQWLIFSATRNNRLAPNIKQIVKILNKFNLKMNKFPWRDCVGPPIGVYGSHIPQKIKSFPAFRHCFLVLSRIPNDVCLIYISYPAKFRNQSRISQTKKA